MEKNNRDGQNNPEKTSLSLGVISSEHPASTWERRHLPRLSLTTEQFRLSRLNRIFSVTDLSENGMGLWLLDSEDLKFFIVGSLLEGFLNLRREKYFLQARVRNLYRDRVGCEFEDLSETVKQALSQFLDPSALGAEMKPIPSTGMNTLWYHGPSGTDLLLRRMPDGQYRRLSLYVLGTFIQWDAEEGLSTGRISNSGERSELRGIVRLETLILYPDPQPDSGKLSIAKKVILSSNLPQDLKNWCTRQLEK